MRTIILLVILLTTIFPYVNTTQFNEAVAIGDNPNWIQIESSFYYNLNPDYSFVPPCNKIENGQTYSVTLRLTDETDAIINFNPKKIIKIFELPAEKLGNNIEGKIFFNSIYEQLGSGKLRLANVIVPTHGSPMMETFASTNDNRQYYLGIEQDSNEKKYYLEILTDNHRVKYCSLDKVLNNRNIRQQLYNSQLELHNLKIYAIDELVFHYGANLLFTDGENEYLMFDRPAELWNETFREYLLPGEEYPSFYFQAWTLYDVKDVYQDVLTNYEVFLKLYRRYELANT